MKRIFIGALLVAGLLITAAWAQQAPPMQEYKFVYQCDEKKLNSLAKEGWELTDMSMAAYGSTGVATCVLKR